MQIRQPCTLHRIQKRFTTKGLLRVFLTDFPETTARPEPGFIQAVFSIHILIYSLFGLHNYHQTFFLATMLIWAYFSPSISALSFSINPYKWKIHLFSTAPYHSHQYNMNDILLKIHKVLRKILP